MIDALDHVHLYVEDIPAAAEWYCKILGFQPDVTFACWYEQGGPYVIHCAAASLSLFRRQAPTPSNTIAFSIQAARLTVLIAKLREWKVPFSVADHTLTWSVYFTDLSGNQLEVTCHDYAAATPVMIAAEALTE